MLVEIWDTGPGIPQELQDRIFEPFFTTKPRDRGWDWDWIMPCASCASIAAISALI